MDANEARQMTIDAKTAKHARELSLFLQSMNKKILNSAKDGLNQAVISYRWVRTDAFNEALGIMMDKGYEVEVTQYAETIGVKFSW